LSPSATPTASHVDSVRDALGRGLHVFCDEPLTRSLADSAELAGLASASGLVTQVDSHNRFVGALH